MTDRKASELAEFLSARRARLTPQDAGLAGQSSRRRVPGLRREELARLAGVSVDYYTRLEQGRSRSASADVLDALAAALQLNDAERQHLHLLAKPEPAQRKRRPRAQTVDVETLRLLELFDQVWSPAFVLGRRLDVLAHNRLAGALITEFRELPAPLRKQPPLNTRRSTHLATPTRSLSSTRPNPDRPTKWHCGCWPIGMRANDISRRSNAERARSTVISRITQPVFVRVVAARSTGSPPPSGR
jgi:transcriptional regulator with XRE-family HTH domain